MHQDYQAFMFPTSVQVTESFFLTDHLSSGDRLNSYSICYPKHFTKIAKI